MHFNKILRKTTHCLLPVSLTFLLLSACAKQRWSEPLQEEDSTEIIAITTVMQEKYRSCPDSMDGYARIFWKSPVTDSGVSGYLQQHSPSFLKFIVSNPLGMVVYAFASDGKMFQILNTTERQHIRGNVRSLAIRKEIPLILAQGDWFAYLNGRFPARPLKVQEITRDTSDQTVWVLLSHTDSNKTPDREWVHIDPAEKKVLGYLFLDKDGKELAEIVYKEQEGKTDECSPKGEILIRDLPWGAEIDIELQDIRTDTEYDESDFSLPVPVNYFKQLQP